MRPTHFQMRVGAHQALCGVNARKARGTVLVKYVTCVRCIYRGLKLRKDA